MIDVEDRFDGSGTAKIPHISMADDMCFVTEDKEEVQPMLTTAETYANREHYTIHPTKTATVQYNCSELPQSPYMVKRFPSKRRQHILVSNAIPNVNLT